MSGLNNTGDKVRNFEWKFVDKQNAFQLHCDGEPVQLCFSKEAVEGAQELHHHLNVKDILFDEMESEVTTFFNKEESEQIMKQLEKVLC